MNKDEIYNKLLRLFGTTGKITPNTEKIYYTNESLLIEKIAHESAMIAAKSEFIKAFESNGIVNTKETGYIINAYYQHKKLALIELLSNYEFKSID